MQDRKRQIVDAAVRLFARQGFHATSIQDIVDELGMAKGSIYFYFKSKDELLVFIFQHYGDMILESMAVQPGEEELAPRARLRLQLDRQLGFYREHSSMLKLLLREPFTGGRHHDELKTFAVRFQRRYTQWLLGHVRDIYGAGFKRYWADGALLLGGFLHAYMGRIAVDGLAPEVDRRLSGFLLRRLDDLMQGLLAEGESPLVTETDLALAEAGCGGDADQGQLAAEIGRLRALTAGTEAEETVQLLEAEWRRAVPNRTALRAYAALLEKQAEPDWQEAVARIGEQMAHI